MGNSRSPKHETIAQAVDRLIAGLPPCCPDEGKGYTYFVEGAKRIKVGRAKDPTDRIRSLQIGSPVRLTPIALVRGDREYVFHGELYKHRLHGEWFRRTGVIALLKNASPDRCVYCGWNDKQPWVQEQRRKTEAERARLSACKVEVERLVSVLSPITWADCSFDDCPGLDCWFSRDDVRTTFMGATHCKRTLDIAYRGGFRKPFEIAKHYSRYDRDGAPFPDSPEDLHKWHAGCVLCAYRRGELQLTYSVRKWLLSELLGHTWQRHLHVIRKELVETEPVDDPEEPVESAGRQAWDWEKIREYFNRELSPEELAEWDFGGSATLNECASATAS